MDFIKHLRPQQKFDSEEHLAQQIKDDCNKAREILNDT
jgi:FAD synthase